MFYKLLEVCLEIENVRQGISGLGSADTYNNNISLVASDSCKFSEGKQKNSEAGVKLP